jgi:phage-related protein
VDVSSRVGRRLVVSTESEEGDIVADDVLVGVNAELEDALASLKTASELVVGVHDLVRSSKNLPGRSEGEGDVAALGLEEAKHALLMLHVRSGRGGSESAESNGEERELHVCFGVEIRVEAMSEKRVECRVVNVREVMVVVIVTKQRKQLRPL